MDRPAPATPVAGTRCYLVRHCDVHNPARVLYGHLPGFGLSEAGVAQAHRLGRALAASPVRVVLTSPLQRARETAAIIAGHLDHVPVEVMDDLREAEFGRYLQGVPYREIPWRRPGWWVHMAWPGLLPGDESVATMSGRVRRQLERVLRDHPGAGGVLVSHGDPIQAYWASAEHRPPWALHRLQCAKGGYLELDFEGTRLVGKRYRSPGALEEEQAAAEQPTPVGA